jgi:hypothetical protein
MDWSQLNFRIFDNARLPPRVEVGDAFRWCNANAPSIIRYDTKMLAKR